MGELSVIEKRHVFDHVFNQYDTMRTGEFTPVQLQILHGDLRIGGISMPQVLASLAYTCATDMCSETELYDALQEMDRRYFLVQDLRWEFSMLDRTQTDLITEEQARWLVQTVHGRYFSKRAWEEFLLRRAVPGSGVSFAEIEVLLCDIPSRLKLEKENKDDDREKEERLRRQRELEEEAEKQRQRLKKEKEENRKKKEQNKKKDDDERRKRELEDDERKKREEEERRKREEEEEAKRLKELEEEEERRRKEEEEKYKDVEKVKEDHIKEEERKEKETEDELNRLKKRREQENDEKRRKQLEDEEAKMSKLYIEHRNKRVRYQLKVAIKSRDKFKLEYSVTEFKKYNLEDTDMDLQKAQRLIKEFTAKDNLKRAMTKREIEELEQAMNFVKKNGFEAQLAGEMQEANQMLSRLKRLERIRHEILELKQSTVAEIRSYSKPPLVVHTVMTVTLLILGHKEKDTKDWKAVQALVGKTGKESLKRQCVQTQAAKIPIAIAKRAKTLLDKFELDEVRDVSAGAATFYVWAITMVEEALDVQK
ncbi:vicilin-like seed storage protein At2g18540 isoform X1 [Haliotis rufescens]|uniref:vicilin-like seed storage protein At2g18540 isoform X1 n=1 Tax=Haliotis rufescens TaxID=6454 RepID=UPI00201F5155|nr:vicilin-like seed storage protein At2g18540 isoform X1 [Haliotis rufescens]